MTTQWLEADAWLASVIQDLYALSDEELLQAGNVPPEPSDESSDDHDINDYTYHKSHSETAPS